jgi:hypothetical protein
MKTYLSRRIPVVVAAGVALAMLALGFLAALGVRSLAAGTASASPAAPNPGHEWSQVEGHGVDGSTYWLGTTADQALELRVNGQRALRLEPSGTESPNIIGGYTGNSVTGGAAAATVGGGGDSYFGANRVTDHCGTVGGGVNNQAGDGGAVDDQACATVSGGLNNTASLSNSTVGGGQGNTASGIHAAIGGGSGNTASAYVATVAGGGYNTASGTYATVGGGQNNVASGDHATVGGGWSNTASANSGTVGGGEGNNASGVHASVVGGGYENQASGDTATVGGGAGNTASGIQGTIGGGWSNTASGHGATVGGGGGNTASGNTATVPGGEANTAQGDYSFAAGYRAKANHTGSFVWADYFTYSVDFASTANNEFSARTTGGARFVSGLDPAGDPAAGVTLAPGGNAWAGISDRSVKANFTSVDGRDVLERLASIPIETWNLKSQDASIRHMGPMAQDFYAAFSLGESDTSITTVDADGVALAAIQGLYQRSQEQADRIQALEEENTSLKQQLDNLEARVTAMEGGSDATAAVSQASSSGLPALWPLLGGGLMLALAGLVLAQRRLAGGRR